MWIFINPRTFNFDYDFDFDHWILLVEDCELDDLFIHWVDFPGVLNRVTTVSTTDRSQFWINCKFCILFRFISWDLIEYRSVSHPSWYLNREYHFITKMYCADIDVQGKHQWRNIWIHCLGVCKLVYKYSFYLLSHFIGDTVKSIKMYK